VNAVGISNAERAAGVGWPARVEVPEECVKQTAKESKLTDLGSTTSSLMRPLGRHPRQKHPEWQLQLRLAVSGGIVEMPEAKRD
jgi:hypothetical protein